MSKTADSTTFTRRLYNMYSSLDSTILVSCSKPSRNRFARFDPNRFRFDKWNLPLWSQTSMSHKNWTEFRIFWLAQRFYASHFFSVDFSTASDSIQLCNRPRRYVFKKSENTWNSALAQKRLYSLIFRNATIKKTYRPIWSVFAAALSN